MLMRLSCLLDDCPAAAYIPADAHDTLVLVARQVRDCGTRPS